MRSSWSNLAGSAIARRLATAGAEVVISGRCKKKGAAVLASTEKTGARAALVVADLMEVEVCRGVIPTAVDKFGGVDILVSSAALNARATLEGFTPEVFDKVFHVNVRATMRCSGPSSALKRADAACASSIPVRSYITLAGDRLQGVMGLLLR